MASLTDIIFLLLIFFMLTSNFVTPNAIKLILPKATSEKQPPKIVTVSVTSNLEYYLEDQQINLEILENALRSHISGDASLSVVLKVDERVQHGEFIKVLKTCNKVTSRVVIATQAE